MAYKSHQKSGIIQNLAPAGFNIERRRNRGAPVYYFETFIASCMIANSSEYLSK